MIRTITDAYQYYVTACGASEPPRSRDELRAYIHARNLRYEELDEEFWDEMFESRWGWGIDDNNREAAYMAAGAAAQVARLRYHAAQDAYYASEDGTSETLENARRVYEARRAYEAAEVHFNDMTAALLEV